MSIVVSKGKDSSIQQMRVGCICYSGVPMGQAYLNGVKIWPDENVYISGVKMRFYDEEDAKGIEIPNSRVVSYVNAIKANTEASSLMNLIVTNYEKDVATLNPQYTKLPCLTYNSSTGYWEFPSTASVPYSAAASSYAWGIGTTQMIYLPSEDLELKDGDSGTRTLTINNKIPIMPNDELSGVLQYITDEYGAGVGLAPYLSATCSQKSSSMSYWNLTIDDHPGGSASSAIRYKSTKMTSAIWNSDFADTASVPNSYLSIRIRGMDRGAAFINGGHSSCGLRRMGFWGVITDIKLKS